METRTISVDLGVANPGQEVGTLTITITGCTCRMQDAQTLIAAELARYIKGLPKASTQTILPNQPCSGCGGTVAATPNA